MSFNRLMYDTCAYKKELDQSTGSLSYTLNPLKFEEARYVNEVTGAMLIWIHRVFAQHESLMEEWKRLSADVDAALEQVRLAKLVCDERRAAVEALLDEARQLKDRDREMLHVAKPLELTTPDEIVLTRKTPNIFFRNGRVAGRSNLGKCSTWELPSRLRLPPQIRFFVRLKSVQVSFPLPACYPASQFLHEARVVYGEEEAGPTAHVPFDSKHVIGLEEHHFLAFTQLVIEVPSTPSINPGLRATRLSFHPRHEAQLHDYTSRMQRIIVPVFATGGTSSERSASAPPRQRHHDPTCKPREPSGDSATREPQRGA